MTIADLLRPGDAVEVTTCEGFGGYGRVVATRPIPTSRCQVRLDDGSQQDFWAHDFELSLRADPAAPYDSRPDTLAHILVVRDRLEECIKDLHRRQEQHDLSKLEEPEKSAFDEFTPKLRASTYGSDEYESFRVAMGPALAHHYANNSHHPEHWTGSRCDQCGNPESEPCTCGGSRTSTAGIRGMSLLDIIEMLADWKAATGRHADGDLAKSIEINQKRFGYSDELKAILTNTAQRLGWI